MGFSLAPRLPNQQNPWQNPNFGKYKIIKIRNPRLVFWLPNKEPRLFSNPKFKRQILDFGCASSKLGSNLAIWMRSKCLTTKQFGAGSIPPGRSIFLAPRREDQSPFCGFVKNGMQRECFKTTLIDTYFVKNGMQRECFKTTLIDTYLYWFFSCTCNNSSIVSDVFRVAAARC